MSQRRMRPWSKCGLVIGLSVVATTVLAGCRESTGVPTSTGFVVSMQADSATANGRVVGGSFQCLMTFTVRGNSSSAQGGAAVTAFSVRIAPVAAASPVFTTKSVFAKAELGFDHVNAGETLHTGPVAMSSQAGAFVAGVWIDYSVNGGAPASTPATVLQCQ